MIRAGKPKKPSANPQLEMTPMIDVVFLLLIFFIVTLKKEDILARLDVIRPEPCVDSVPPDHIELLNIAVFKDSYVIKGRPVGIETLESCLARVAAYSKSVSVIIRCANDSQHGRLVRVLDVCSKLELKDVSVFSM